MSNTESSFKAKTTLKTPIPERVTSIGSASDMTREARRILDQVLIRISRMTPADRDVLILALRHAARELELASQSIQQNKVPSELEGLPASLALMTCLKAVMTGNLDIRTRFQGFVKEAEKLA
jgi:hypothetical protein